MSPASFPLAKRQRDWSLPAGLLVSILLLVAGGNLAGNSALTPIMVDRAINIPGWEHGSLFHVLALWLASLPSALLEQHTALLLIYVALASLIGALVYKYLRNSDWPGWQASLALVLLATHGVLLHAVTTASPDLLLVVAAGALIPSARRLEAVGDVQAIINFGLTLTLLVMAGPQLAVLVPLLMFAVPLREAEARQKPYVFGAMLVVSVAPALIVIAGLWAMAAHLGVAFSTLSAPFVEAFTPQRSLVLPSLILIAATAPMSLVLLVHSAIPDRRRKVLTSLLAVALPFYIAVGNSYFAWDLATWTPAAVAVATAVGWLCTTRVRAWMRWLVLGLLVVSSAGSWLLASQWSDPAWLDGLLPIQLYAYDIAVPGFA